MTLPIVSSNPAGSEVFMKSAETLSCSTLMETEGKGVGRVVKTENGLLGAGYHKHRDSGVFVLPVGFQNRVHGFSMRK